MSERLRKRTLVFAVLFFLISMSGMLVYAREKVIVIADVAQDQIDGDPYETETRQTVEAKPLLFRSGEEETRLCIPLKAGTRAESVLIENRYMSRELWIAVENCEASFYDNQAVSGNMEGIQAGTYEGSGTKALLKFRLSDIYECRNVLEDDRLYIELVPPGEIYDKIVVVDPACGGENSGCVAGKLKEKEIALDIVRQLKEKLDKTDIKVYYTRMEDTNPDVADRIGLANEVGADMFISIGLAENREDETEYGTEAVYNDSYFLPDFGSVQWADLVEREVVTRISGRGNGLFPAKETDTLIREARVPAVLLKAGYLSNPQEAALLAREDYREKIAEGIYQAILKAYGGAE